MSTAFHLDSEGWDTVVDMINYCLIEIEGSDYGLEDLEEAKEFEKRIRQLAERMGLDRRDGYGEKSSSS